MSSEFYEYLRVQLNNEELSMKDFAKRLSSDCMLSCSFVKSLFKPSNQHLIPWRVIRQATKYVKIDLREVEKMIISYGVPRCRSPVVNPKLPIVHTPILDMLVAHTIADGSVVRSQGRIPYLSFRQHNEKFMKSYRRQCEYVFGNIPSIYHGRDHTKSYLPAAPSQAVFTVSNMTHDDFLSTQAQMPEYIFRMPLIHQFAFLLAFFSDEGHVGSCNIVIRLKNIDLIHGLEKICDNLEYKTTVTSYPNNMHQIYIRTVSLRKFYTDLQNIKLRYDFIDLDYKEKKLINNLERNKKPAIYIPGNKPLIVASLQRQSKTVNQLAHEFSMTRQGMRFHIQTLMKRKKVRRVKVIPGKPPEYLYGIWE